MAWVEQRGDGFRVRYRLPDGTLHTENGFPTQQAADNRAADIESDQRRERFVDPRLAQTTIDEWIRMWTDAHHVSQGTWDKYDSHIRTHILPRWSGTALGDIQRILVKGWANKTLRPKLASKTVQDIMVLFSMILGEAVDEGLIGANPCRKLRLHFDSSPERPHASGDDVDAIAGRMAADYGLLTITAAYTGMRWGELAGLQWIRTHLDHDPRIDIDPELGALHEIRGRLELGPPKTPASARPVHLPRFLVDLLTDHRDRNHVPGSCSPAPTVACCAGPTSAAAPGYPPWRANRSSAGRPSTPACTSMTFATPTRPGSSKTTCPESSSSSAWATSARTSTTATPTSPQR